MSKRILFVDDSRAIRALVSELLKKAGYEVLLGTNGEEGASICSHELPDLVVSDISMPVADGYALCSRIKGAPATASIPVLLFTRLNEATDILRGLDAGADGFLLKTAGTEQLLSRIGRVFAEQKTPRKRETVKAIQKQLPLTSGRLQMFTLCFDAMWREVPFDVLALLIHTEDKKKKRTFVTVSRAPLPALLIHWMVKQMTETSSVLGGADGYDEKDLQVESICLDPTLTPIRAGSGVPPGALKIPLLESGTILGSLGIFAFEPSAEFGDNIRFFFDIGVEFARALRKVSSGTSKKESAKPKRAKPRAKAQQVARPVQVYMDLLDEIWRDVHPLIGTVTLSALFSSAARRVSTQYRCLAGLEVSAEGVSRSSLGEALGSTNPREATKAVAEMTKELLTLFELIAGPIILKQVFPRVIRAESELALIKR